MTLEIDADLVKEIVGNEKRLDYRKFDQYRDIVIETDFITSAEGSARVRLGDSVVVAGVKMDVGEPFPDTPDEGVMMVAAEFLPLASPEFEPGPPGENAIELSRVVDRAIRESKCIDFKKLCITPGEKVWMVFIDLDILDDDGNLIDAAGLAAMAALLNARMPALKEDGRTDYDNKTDKKLPMSGVAVSTTFAKIADRIIADPSYPEWRALDARLTVGTVDKGGKTMLSSMQKGGSYGFTLEEIEYIVGKAVEKGDELRSKIKEAVS
ncbi:MAG: exosome complex protein Rrp42 [Candidatus Aenigmarchaeota archaeon]|nr:exosome complex protein Rrp42 [Candidatus Aenigmarchaeota archaeon]